MTFSSRQQIVLAIVPKISGGISMVGSAWIVIEVLTTGEKRRNVYNRLLLAISCIDLLTSAWYFASTWPMPEGTEQIYGARGTIGTCNAQGFFLQFAISSPICKAV